MISVPQCSPSSSPTAPLVALLLTGAGRFPCSLAICLPGVGRFPCPFGLRLSDRVILRLSGRTVAILLAALLIAAGTVRALYFPLYLLAHCVRAALQQPHLFIGSYGFHLFRFLEIVFPFTCWVARALHERASRRALKQSERVAEQQLELREMKLIDDGVRRENAALAKLSADKEVLLGQISHEMKTPLNGLVGMLTVAQMRLGSAQQATKIAKLVEVETSLEKAQLCGKVRLPSPPLPSPRPA